MGHTDNMDKFYDEFNISESSTSKFTSQINELLNDTYLIDLCEENYYVV